MKSWGSSCLMPYRNPESSSCPSFDHFIGDTLCGGEWQWKWIGVFSGNSETSLLNMNCLCTILQWLGAFNCHDWSGHNLCTVEVLPKWSLEEKWEVGLPLQLPSHDPVPRGIGRIWTLNTPLFLHIHHGSWGLTGMLESSVENPCGLKASDEDSYAFQGSVPIPSP